MLLIEVYVWNGESIRIILENIGRHGRQYEKNKYDSRDEEITFDSDCDSYVDGYNRSGSYQWIYHLESIFAFIFISNV